MESPTKRLIKREITGVLLPTAAKALLPANLPTTATSTELNNCCRTLLAARGSAKRSILGRSAPSSIFIFVEEPLIIRRYTKIGTKYLASR